MDIPTLFHALPVNLRFLVKSEVRRIPFLGWYIGAMGMVFVERGRRVSGVNRVRQAAKLVGSGRHLVSFPEGTRSRDGSFQPFKTGSFVAAIEAGVPVLPVAIEGTGRILPPEGFRMRPGLIRVMLGEPVATEGLGPEDRHQLAKEMHRRIALMLEELASRPAPRARSALATG